MNDAKDSKILDGPIELFNLIVTSDSRWFNFETDYNVLIKYFIQKGRILYPNEIKNRKIKMYILCIEAKKYSTTVNGDAHDPS